MAGGVSLRQFLLTAMSRIIPIGTAITCAAVIGILWLRTDDERRREVKVRLLGKSLTNEQAVLFLVTNGFDFPITYSADHDYRMNEAWEGSGYCIPLAGGSVPAQSAVAFEMALDTRNLWRLRLHWADARSTRFDTLRFHLSGWFEEMGRKPVGRVLVPHKHYGAVFGPPMRDSLLSAN